MECCGGLKVKAMLKNNAVKSERRFLSMVGRYVDEYLHNLSKARQHSANHRKRK